LTLHAASRSFPRKNASKERTMKTSKMFFGLAVAGVLAFAAPAFAQSPAAAPAGTAMKAAAKAPLLDINSASKSELQALKGVGDKRADDIIKGRPYSGKDDLVSRKIIPKGVYDGIKDKIIAKQK
jgi:DNA uptake protein ComE-like DNA-binding protein